MNPAALVLMNGPAFDGSGEIVERDVAERDVLAYQKAGYKFGPGPQKVVEEVPAPKPKKKK